MSQWDEARSHGSGRLWRRAKVFVAAAALALGLGVPAKLVLSASSDESPAPPITLPTWTSDYFWNAGDGYAGWHKHVTATDETAYGLEPGLADAPGLWLWPTGERRYEPGGAEWLLRAPGTTRIARARISLSYRPKLFSHHCLAIGLRVGDVQRDQRVSCKPPLAAAQDNYDLGLADPAGAPTSKEVYVQIVVPDCKGKGNGSSCSKYIPAEDPRTNGAMVHVKSVQMVLVDDDLPVVTPSKAFYELDGTYIDGKQTYPLRVDSDDAGAGITGIDIDHRDNPPLAAYASVCDAHHHTAELGARVCPKSDAIELDVDTRPMPEGTRRFRAYSPDPAGNVGESRWTVIIDRTPPTPPQNLHFTTPEEGSAQVAWDAATDPVLPDGTPGSGVKHYQSRYRVNSGDWSNWQTMDEDARLNDEVYDKPAGTHVDFEVRAIDAVGNVGEAASAGGEVYGSPPNVSVSGRLPSLDNDYIGSEQADLTVSASDDGVGVRRVWFERDSLGEIASADAGCTPRMRNGSPWKDLCPASATHTFTVDTGQLSEGDHVFTAGAVDRAHNVSDNTSFDVLVDHTAPSAPTSVFLSGFDSASGEVDLNWDDGEDPSLADGHPGSGADTTDYRILRGSSWSDWQNTDDGAVTLSGVYSGETIGVELRTIDAVGNASAITSATLTVGSEREWTPQELQELEQDKPDDSVYDRPYDPSGYDAPIGPDGDGSEYQWGTDADAGMPGAHAAAAAHASAAPKASASSNSQYDIWLKGLNLNCSGSAARVAQNVCVLRDPYAKTKRKEEEERCFGELRRELGPDRAERYCPTDYGNPPDWTWVYRLVRRSTHQVYYVGITNNPARRCEEHGFISFDRKYCQMLMVVPNRGVALSVEQFLMEAYGFAIRPANIDYDTGERFGFGWFNDWQPLLTNKRRNFSAKRARPLYCASIFVGMGAINLYLPQLQGHYPPGTRFWWPNFPGRDCFPVHYLQDQFRDAEGRRPANERL